MSEIQRKLRKLSQEGLDYIVANSGQFLIDNGYVMLNELVDGVPNGAKMRITGAMFQTWIPVDMWERMEVSTRNAE